MNVEEKRYPALRTVAAIYKIMAWVMGLGCVAISILMAGAAGNSSFQYLYFILPMVGGALLALTLYAIAEGILVFLDIEENTRWGFAGSTKPTKACPKPVADDTPERLRRLRGPTRRQSR